MSGTGMTIVEKILAAHAGRERVSAGERLRADVDLILARGGSAGAAESGAVRPGMTVLGADPEAAGLGAFGCCAVAADAPLLEEGRLRGQATLEVPATVLCHLLGEARRGVHAADIALAILSRLGAGQTRGKVLEFAGDVLRFQSMEARLVLCAAASSAGAAGAIIPADAVAFRYVCARAFGSFVSFNSDPDAGFDSIVEIDVAAIEPMAAFTPGGAPRAAAGSSQAIQRAELGPGPGGLLEDLRQAAELVRGRRVAAGVLAVVAPATPDVMARARAEGLIDDFMIAGWRVVAPAEESPAAPAGGMAIRVAGAAAGRDAAGTGETAHCAASPLTVAASSITGSVSDPRPFLPPEGEINAGQSRDDRRRQERPRERGGVLALFPGKSERKEGGRSVQPS